MRGVTSVRNQPRAPASYEIGVYARPGGVRHATGTMTAEPSALLAVANGGQAILELETGEELEIVPSHVSGSQCQFYVKTPIPGFDD